MWRDLGEVAGRVLLSWLPLAIIFAVGFEWGWFRDTVFALLGLSVVAVTISTILSLRLWRSAARDAVEALGPDVAADNRPRRLSPAARAIRPAVLRLDRTWQEHAAQTETRLAAAEAVIAAVPDPLILIDHQRRIVRSNAAAAEFIGPGAEPRDLAAALRNPVLLAAADSVLRGERVGSVEFTLSVPIERVLRAHLARIADGPNDRGPNDRGPNDRGPNDRGPNDRGPNDRGPNDRGPNDRGPEDRPALDGAAAILTLHDVTALKRSEQMRADFIANAGHELKTPLATLIGFIETLLGPAREDAVARDRFLGIMKEQAARMARLVDDLLSLSRIELNEHVAPTGRVALAPLVDEVARGLELRAAERGIRIACALPADLPEVQGDRDELAQIFQNLIDNAVKYGRPHSEVAVTGGIGGTGGIGATATAAAAGLVRVEVADRGDGISSEHLPRLTERFYRVDTARSRELGGTGLGLAIVKHILNRHRGRLDIASTVGHGSTFTVSLRAAEAPIALSAPQGREGGDPSRR